MKKHNANARKLNPHAEYVLKSAMPRDPLLMAYYRLGYVCAYQGGVKATRDFFRAMKFSGAWLNDTCWFFETFWEPVQYEIEAINAQKAKEKKPESPTAGLPPGSHRHAGVRAKALDRSKGDRVRKKRLSVASKRKLENKKKRKSAPGGRKRAHTLRQ